MGFRRLIRARRDLRTSKQNILVIANLILMMLYINLGATIWRSTFSHRQGKTNAAPRVPLKNSKIAI